MGDWRDLLGAGERELLEQADHPEWLEPMAATLTHEHFSDPGWIFEPKLDGERALAFRRGSKLRLMSRNRKSINDSYPELEAALAGLDCGDFVLDGEIVAFEAGVSSFSRLQQRMQIADREAALATDTPVCFYVFDLPWLKGYRLDAIPLRRRKSVLRRWFKFGDPIRFTNHRNEHGQAFLRQACRKGWEGIIAKRADSPYRHSRSRDWLKFKCGLRQELVIGGFTEPRGERTGFGALLVGYFDAGELRYAGKVGTGYDEEFLRTFSRRLEQIECERCPFAEEPGESRVHWVRPKLVGEFGFTEWTNAGKLRHPRFLGLRRDKAAEDVVREGPAD